MCIHCTAAKSFKCTLITLELRGSTMFDTLVPLHSCFVYSLIFTLITIIFETILRAYEFLLKFYEFPESHIYRNCIEFLHASPFCAASATCKICYGNRKCHSHILLPHVYTEHVLLNFLCILLCNHIFHNYILYVHALIECDYLKRFSRYICNHIWYICV